VTVEPEPEPEQESPWKCTVPAFFENVYHAHAAFKKSQVITPDSPETVKVEWARVYRQGRDGEMDSDEAVTKADEAVTPKSDATAAQATFDELTAE